MTLRNTFGKNIFSASHRGSVGFVALNSIDEKPWVETFGSTGTWFYERMSKDTLWPYFETLDFDISDKTPCYTGNQDLVFFSDHHGFTVRVTTRDHVGNLEDDFYRRMHGYLVSPIGWARLKEDGRDIGMLYLYPGERLIQNNKNCVWDEYGGIGEEMPIGDTGFTTNDCHGFNVGYVDYDSNQLNVAIDTDCVRAIPQRIAQNKQDFETALQDGLNPGQAYAKVTAQNSIGSEYEATPYRHQDLRNAFFEAWPGAHEGKMDADPEKIQAFLQACVKKVSTPRYVQKHFWSQYTNEQGVQVWRKHVSPAEREQLHPSWKIPFIRP